MNRFARWRRAHDRITLTGRGCGVRQEHIPGALSISRELSLSGLVGPGTWRPPTCVGTPGSNTPTAIVAPHPFTTRPASGFAVPCLQTTSIFRRGGVIRDERHA